MRWRPSIFDGEGGVLLGRGESLRSGVAWPCLTPDAYPGRARRRIGDSGCLEEWVVAACARPGAPSGYAGQAVLARWVGAVDGAQGRWRRSMTGGGEETNRARPGDGRSASRGSIDTGTSGAAPARGGRRGRAGPGRAPATNGYGEQLASWPSRAQYPRTMRAHPHRPAATARCSHQLRSGPRSRKGPPVARRRRRPTPPSTQDLQFADEHVRGRRPALNRARPPPPAAPTFPARPQRQPSPPAAPTFPARNANLLPPPRSQHRRRLARSAGSSPLA